MPEFNPPVPPGKCEICGHERMEVKSGYYACPGFYGSPMHWCSPHTMSDYPHGPAEVEVGQRLAQERLEAYCGCTLEEYLAARDKLTESLFVEEVHNARDN